ncbi:hypothetical protein HPB47_022779 [Ixodes persulcatus]|uniref:Uncharacterized protein n=1 Tax=Ixodes persulcatus TaxID=34615 RepID=A0AC60QAR0_IXOPE|nr:hypothetical protein HPB47_022779 [Ixodes persulcatus]
MDTARIAAASSRVPALECIVNVRAVDGAGVCVDLDCSEDSSNEPVPLSLGWISSSKKLFSTSYLTLRTSSRFKPADFTPFPTCGDEVGGAAVSPGVPGVVPGGAACSPSGVATTGVAVVGGVASVDDYLPYSFHRKAPYLVWDDERSSACRRGLSARSRSRSWGRAPARCCPWRCVLLVALASAVLFGSLVALCAYLSALAATRYKIQLQAAYRKSPQLNSSLSKVTIYAFRQGSLIVLFELEIDKRRTPTVDNLETKFKKTLQEEIEKGPMGAFGNLKIDENAIQLTAGTTDYWSNQNDADSTGHRISRENDSSLGPDEYNSWQPFFPEQQDTDTDVEGTTWDDGPTELGDDSDPLPDAPIKSSDESFHDTRNFTFA